MAEPLKHFFNEKIVTRIADMISAVSPEFPAAQFKRDATVGLDQLELVPRGRHIAHALDRHLPRDYRAAAGILQASLGPPLERTEGNGLAPFLYLPHVIYVAERGLDDLETSLGLQYELTRRFSAEFSIRGFLERYPDATLARLREWAHDPDVHVRRLVSEGTRPRLPWAPRLKAFQADPACVVELLELLKDDPELYVRRSVANNLNDIGKDHPEVLTGICERWLADATPERMWVIRHALQSAIKRGEPAALRALGYNARVSVRVDNVKITPRRAWIGGLVELSFDLVNTARTKQSLLVDLRVHYVKANGKSLPKVFKLNTLNLAPSATARLSHRLSLRQMSIRKHYPGVHRVEALVNGSAFPLGGFTLV